MKPTNFTQNIRTHSFRRSAINLLEESVDVHKDWAKMRAGFCLDKVDTYNKYYKGTDKTDAYCARILSRWGYFKNGGHCPSIECIPESQKQKFLNYTKELFKSALPDLAIDIACMLNCILILHFPSVYELFPNHELISKMLKHEDLKTIYEWHEIIKENFIHKNKLYVPPESSLHTILDINLQVSKSTQEILSNHVLTSSKAHKTSHDYQKLILEKLTSLENKYNELSSSVANCMCVSVDEHTDNNNNIDNCKKRTYYQSTLKMSTSISNNNDNSSNKQSKISQYTISNNNNEEDPLPFKGDDGKSYLHSLFYKWYTDEKFRNYSSINATNRSEFKKLKNMVGILRSFLDDNTIIEAMPKSDDDYDTYCKWLVFIKEQSNKVQSRAINFILKEENVNIWNETNKKININTISKGSIWATEKRFKTLQQHNIYVPEAKGLVDNIYK